MFDDWGIIEVDVSILVKINIQKKIVDVVAKLSSTNHQNMIANISITQTIN